MEFNWEKMTFGQALTALIAIIGVGWIIFIKIMGKNPQALEKMKEWFRNKKAFPIQGEDYKQQIYQEKRMGI